MMQNGCGHNNMNADNTKCTKSRVPEGFVYPNLPSKCTWKPPSISYPHTNRQYACHINLYPDILHVIGNTPMVKLNKIPQSEGIKCDIYAKCEFLNPGGSVKDRIGYRMIEDAEAEGKIGPGSTIIEATSGNTGIGVAMACAVKGYACIIVMPQKMSNEKVNALKVLGAKIVRTPTEAAFDSSEGLIAVAQRLNHEIPNSIVLGQYTNKGNPLTHYDGTAEEILQQCGGKIDMIVIGAGTGGTITGIARKFQEKCPNCKIVSVDPEGSILALPEDLNKKGIGFYEIEGLGYDFLPTVLDRDLVHKWYKSDDKESFLMARRINLEEGLLSGGSSGANLAAALKACKELKEGDRCVVILPDGIRNYMTKYVSDNWMEARFYKEPVNEFGHWWWDYQISELPLNSLESIGSEVSCQDAIRTMNKKNIQQMGVRSADGTLKGTVALADLTNKIVSMNLSLSTPVEDALYKQYRTIPQTSNLGLASRILEKDDFLMLDGSDVVVTRKDILEFITDGGQQANGVKNGIH